MDIGWVLYGILLIVGALLTFDLRGGPRPVVVLAVLAGVGVSCVGIFQGANANVANGLIVFHTYGAQGVMLAGNLMAIAVDVNATRIGLGRGRRVASMGMGCPGGDDRRREYHRWSRRLARRSPISEKPEGTAQIRTGGCPRRTWP